MYDVSKIDPPTWGDKESGLRFVSECLSAWATAYASYTNRESAKQSIGVEAKVAAIKENDPDAVEIADETMTKVRGLLLSAVNVNPNVASLVFPELGEATKVIGSYRSEATVTPVVEVPESDDDRDIMAEYEALKKAQTAIQGTMMSWEILPSDLPPDFQEKAWKVEGGKRIETSEVKVKFPGKLHAPSDDNASTGAGREATTSRWTFTLETDEGETLSFPKGTLVVTIARVCSLPDWMLSFSDLKDRLDNRKWSEKETTSLEVRVPRGYLFGERIDK